MSWFRYIDICSDDVIMVKVTMTRQTFQQLLNPEIDQMEVFGDICTGQVTTGKGNFTMIKNFAMKIDDTRFEKLHRFETYHPLSGQKGGDNKRKLLSIDCIH